MAKDEIRFFGAIDRDGNKEGGAIKHSYPAWYSTNKLDDLRGEIDEIERTLDRADDLVGAARDSIPSMRRKLREKKERLFEIEATIPKLNDIQKDKIAKLRQEIQHSILDITPTYTDERRGTASAHEEAKKMIEPCISVPHGAAMLMQEMGISAARGDKISRNDAVKFWKITGRLLGERTHSGLLRRDAAYGTYQIHKSLEEMEQG